jgi:hypothetical protein
MPWRKLTRKEMRAQAKPWLTQGILNSIQRKDKLLRKCIQAKDPIRKEILRTEFKPLRNRITYIVIFSEVPLIVGLLAYTYNIRNSIA